VVITEFLRRFPQASLAVEPVSQWYFYADLMQQLGVDVHLAHPVKVKAVASARIKTDETISKLIAGAQESPAVEGISACCHGETAGNTRAQGIEDLLVRTRARGPLAWQGGLGPALATCHAGADETGYAKAKQQQDSGTGLGDLDFFLTGVQDQACRRIQRRRGELTEGLLGGTHGRHEQH
jgi:hypothetical protein